MTKKEDFIKRFEHQTGVLLDYKKDKKRKYIYVTLPSKNILSDYLFFKVVRDMGYKTNSHMPRNRSYWVIF